MTGAEVASVTVGASRPAPIPPGTATPAQIAGMVLWSRTRYEASQRLEAWWQAHARKHGEAPSRFAAAEEYARINLDIGDEIRAVAEGRGDDVPARVRIAWGIGMDSARRAHQFDALDSARVIAALETTTAERSSGELAELERRLRDE